MDILVKELVEKGRLKTPTIIKAFEKIDRADFVGEENLDYAYIDEALPIGEGQTISQPTTVAIMLELLQPKSGDDILPAQGGVSFSARRGKKLFRDGNKVLDIGFGSGWTTALLAEIVGAKGQVYAIEIIKEIFEFGKKNIEKYNFKNIKYFNQDGSQGLSEYAPFDKILASAAVDQVPLPLKEQLKINGILVLPVRDSIFKIIKKSKSEFAIEEHPFFAFVPMRGRFGQK
jgi:protein-L-isoaspartate(D-aspartate) O-methyltransferase